MRGQSNVLIESSLAVKSPRVALDRACSIRIAELHAALDARFDVALVGAEDADDQLQRQALRRRPRSRSIDSLMPLNVQMAAAGVPPSMKLR